MGTKRDARQSAPGSFIHAARREQIVRSAIAVIAHLGAANASVVKIALHAGVSRGVVTYHFRDADDLSDAVVDAVYRLGGEQLRERVAGAADPRAAVLTFVAGSVDFYAEYPDHIAALGEIFGDRRRTAARSRGASVQHGRELADLEALLRAGQDSGQFRSFEVGLMARAIRSVLDVAPPLLRESPTDVAQLRDELTQTVDRMIRRDH